MTTSMQRVKVTPPACKPWPYGLLKSIEWLDSDGDRWIFDGIQYLELPTFGTNPLDIMTANDPAYVKPVQHLPVTYLQQDPASALLRVQASTGRYTLEELQAAVNEAFDAQAGLYVEAAAYGSSTHDGFAVGTDVDLVTGGSPPTLIGALAELEAVWSEEQGDVEPTLHIPYFAYPYLEQCAGGLFQTIGDQLYTVGGTPVVLGGGYTNLKKDGTASATGITSIHMTGNVFGLRSAVLRPVQLHDMAGSLDTNDLEVQVEASYVCGWTSSKSYAAYGTICS